MGKAVQYQIIYADPPWSYRDKCNSGKRGVEFKYQCMTPDQIAALDVAGLSAKDAACFLWVTAPQLPIGLQILEAWGFRFKTIAFVWVKTNAKSGSLAWGMGNWTRANAELVLLGTRGKPKRIDAGVHQIVQAARGKHSAKPAIVRSRIVQLMGDLPRVELFAREQAEGWDVWGNEVQSSEGVQL